MASKKYIVISIDVEPDCSLNWHYTNPIAFKGVSEGIAKRLHPLFNHYEIKPTYLINNVVLENNECIDIFKNLSGSFELGTHLHPEFIEPQKEVFDYGGKRSDANCCFYSPHIESAKIKNITNLFIDKFGYRPTSFRAGRFSAGENTMNTLAELNYKVDTSITPHVTWADKTRPRPVDFSKAQEQPYFMKNGKMFEEDKQGVLLQVPLTISLKPANIIQELKESVFGIRRPIRQLRPFWLRPFYSTNKEFETLIKEYSDKYADNKVIIFNMMFHNVEVLPSLSPYTRTESDCTAYLHQLEMFFKYCKFMNIEPIKLSDVYQLYRNEK